MEAQGLAIQSLSLSIQLNIQTLTIAQTGKSVRPYNTATLIWKKMQNPKITCLVEATKICLHPIQVNHFHKEKFFAA